MKPFEDYPDAGRSLIGILKGGNCRHGYGLEFMKKTGQTKCAYCETDLTTSYEIWLTMVLDHIIPTSVAKSLNISLEWREDCSNKVLACAACNSFHNKYKPSGKVCPLTLESLDAFFALRDEIFIERKALIIEKHKEERNFFNNRPWEMNQTQRENLRR